MAADEEQLLSRISNLIARAADDAISRDDRIFRFGVSGDPAKPPITIPAFRSAVLGGLVEFYRLRNFHAPQGSPGRRDKTIGSRRAVIATMTLRFFLSFVLEVTYSHVPLRAKTSHEPRIRLNSRTNRTWIFFHEILDSHAPVRKIARQRVYIVFLICPSLSCFFVYTFCSRY